MKILESYKKIAKSMLTEHAWDRKFGEPLPTLEDVMREAEVDDDKIIKYKDKDGESQEMTAGAAKKMDKDHPAKQAWDKLADKGGEEEPKGKGLEPDDFERDFDPEKPDDEPSFGGDTGVDADFGMGDDWEDDEDARAAAFADMEDEFGDGDEWDESIKKIDGKKYKKVKEEKTVIKKHILRETYEKIGGK